MTDTAEIITDHPEHLVSDMTCPKCGISIIPFACNARCPTPDCGFKRSCGGPDE